MSWRRFRALYRALSPDSLTCLNYDRIASKRGGGAAEQAAWRALMSRSKSADFERVGDG